jgi:hypothetical protein
MQKNKKYLYREIKKENFFLFERKINKKIELYFFDYIYFNFK